MKATEAKLLEFMKKSPQFVIPIYQRTYSWTERECRQLWDDIIRTGENEEINAHFVGSIVYIEKGLYSITSQSPLLVIDGQQRLTTLSLLIAALANKLDQLPQGKQELIEGFSPRKLRNYYLVNPEEEGDRHFKLILSNTDRESLIAVVSGNEMPKNHSIRIMKNYERFQEWIEGYASNLEVLCKGIAKLIVVDIALSRDQDNPQLIFESMNSTGKELTQADLIRNYILMGLEIKKQTSLYENYWRPMEMDFGQEAYSSDFDSFMRHYLTVKTGRIPRISEVYDAFKEYSMTMRSKGIDIGNIVEDIRRFSRFYCAMTLNQENDKELRVAFNDLKELKVDVAYPMLLEVYDDYQSGLLTKEDFVNVIRLVEAYVFRRNICSIPTNSLNKTFATFVKTVDRTNYLESVKAQFILLPSYRRFPNDIEFVKELKTRDLYNIPRRSYWLRRLENFNRKERVEVDQYTIEHIMPQNPNLSEEWKQELGPEWKRIHETWLHTLGNLTLTGYNSEYSDRSFVEKRDMENGFKDSPIKMNQTLRNIDVWNEGAITERAKALSDIAVKVWESPKLANDVLDGYRPTIKDKNGYTIDDYPFLSPKSTSYVERMRNLFEALRKEVLAMDPVVVEEHLKLYIAFKAETNFLDVVPQSKRLRLSLNMPFSEISDPRGICENVAGVGRWGNGEVEVGFSEIDDLPYIMSLVRQSFERQMNNGSESE
ncbi:MAG: DUF262 domain-containing protein [Prevotella sp.]|nr:DUF262 domain-containing protein [Prevotella sp.]